MKRLVKINFWKKCHNPFGIRPQNLPRTSWNQEYFPGGFQGGLSNSSALGRREGLILVEGGERRQDSVHKALEHIHQHDELPDMVLIHDGARIFCTRI